MAVFAKIGQVKGGLAVVLSEEVLSHWNAKENDTVEFVMSQGTAVEAYDSEFEKQMAATRYVMEKHKDILRMLADQV